MTHLIEKSNFEKNILEDLMLISKAYAYSQGALVFNLSRMEYHVLNYRLYLKGA